MLLLSDMDYQPKQPLLFYQNNVLVL